MIYYDIIPLDAPTTRATPWGWGSGRESLGWSDRVPDPTGNIYIYIYIYTYI